MSQTPISPQNSNPNAQNRIAPSARPVAKAKKGANDLAAEFEAQRQREKAGGFIVVARNALKTGDRAKAQQAIKDAFAVNPGDAAAIDLLGDIYLEEGETERALQLYERALQAHPGNANFEEKLAICKLDLAEIEADKLLKGVLLETGDQGKVFERSTAKAVTLSLILPGAGQFYNEENEKGVAFLVGYLLSSVGWFYPLWNALLALPKGQRLDYGTAISSLSGLSALSYRVFALLSLVVMVVAIWDAANVTKIYNEARRQRLGLS